ncbi:hypothetical protein [Nitrobacter sp.]|uniref:hypothetical protein n=1 Tax=Nitrobacter sp. TaxID=29420 RepID=UPI0013EF673B|nr:hypothetical protein [Nitrobacter sp.]MCB1392416.1 hypothetical protein [Nitrobacter sp.]MCV0386897.1 hypothetical protein [Nitrobacter sp.]
MNECPTYFIEREIGLPIEAQDRPIEESDFRDMKTFCAVVAYADIVVAESRFSNLAVQSGLHRSTPIVAGITLLAWPSDGLWQRSGKQPPPR